jgi:competence protein ComEC
MLNKTENIPALKFLIMGALGFFLHKFVISTNLYFFEIIFTLIIAAICFLILKKNTMFIVITLLLFGIITSYRTRNLDFSQTDDFPAQINGLFKGKVLSTLKSNDKVSRYIIEGDVLAGKMYSLKNIKMHFTLINSKKLKIDLERGNSIYTKLQFRFPNASNLPGEFDEKSYYRSIYAHFTGFAFVQDLAVTDTTSVNTFADEVSASVEDKIYSLFSTNTAPIVLAIILGDQTKIPQEIRQNFALSGTAHILSVSGLHVGIIAIIIFWCLSFLKNPWLKFSIFSLVLWSYALLVDLQPAVIRASLMIMLFILSKTLQRKTEPLNIIAVTVLIITVIDPEMLYSAGFQMSIASIAGIALLYQPIYDFFSNLFKFVKIKSLKSFIVSNFSLTFSATIVVSPIVAYYFNTFSIISPFANLLGIPLMVLAQIYSIVAILLSYLSFFPANMLAMTAQLLIELSEIITQYAIMLPGAYIQGENILLLSIFISIGLFAFLTIKNMRQFSFRIILVSLVLCIVFLLRSGKESVVRYYNRPTSRLIELIDKNSYIIEEKPGQVGRGYDYGLFVFFSKLNTDSRIFYEGETGDALQKKNKNLKAKFIKLETEKFWYLKSRIN